MTFVFEIKCVLCSELAGRTLDPWTYQPLTHRCPRCGGCLYSELVDGDPREFGLVAKPEPLPQRYAREEPGAGCCRDCGTPTFRAERCRRCYLRHRYATNPAVRAKQLRLQAEWRRRQTVARKEARECAP